MSNDDDPIVPLMTCNETQGHINIVKRLFIEMWHVFPSIHPHLHLKEHPHIILVSVLCLIQCLQVKPCLNCSMHGLPSAEWCMFMTHVVRFLNWRVAFCHPDVSIQAYKWHGAGKFCLREKSGIYTKRLKPEHWLEWYNIMLQGLFHASPICRLTWLDVEQMSSAYSTRLYVCEVKIFLRCFQFALPASWNVDEQKTCCSVR